MLPYGEGLTEFISAPTTLAPNKCQPRKSLGITGDHTSSEGRVIIRIRMCRGTGSGDEALVKIFHIKCL